MKAGVSTACLYPLEVEKAFRSLAENGVKLTEIFVNSDCELRDPYLKEFLEIQKMYDVRVSSVHPYTCGIEPMMLFTDYERRLWDMLDYFERFFDFMNKLGAKYFVIHGNKTQNFCEDEFYFERFRAVQERARSFGITAVQENVARCTSRSLGFLKKMADNLGDDAKFVLDTKQAHRSGIDPIKIVRVLGEHIVHVHFSDYGKKGDCLKFGDGEYDNLSLFRELKKIGYKGDIVIELYRSGFKSVEDLCNNYRKLNEFLTETEF
ncbi:MAG: sugar phosphate isomerase/epimerase [Oscillospiraceae bacterium]|nr:sugar phosphate isomerase/epimerase [Oscillospiraceae bacterium]